MDDTATNGQSIDELNRKIDVLTEQVAFLTEEARREQRRRQEWDELKNDLTPVASDVYRVAVRELTEVDGYFSSEDVFRLVKRLVRNTRNLEQMLDQMESFAALWQDASPLTRDAFVTLLSRLEEAEQKGYFMFLRGGLDIADRVVSSYSEEDVQQLGENIVLILDTVKEMTQPEIMTLMRSTAATFRDEEPPENVSLFTIIRQLNDPAVKRGLSKTLTVLGSVSEN
ncbi:MAG: DUF1641 domain-containing protein [Candidatus Promineifilaceae bacterium]|jgi:uncharacterized protein YjgD (DUF1641 family)